MKNPSRAFPLLFGTHSNSNKKMRAPKTYINLNPVAQKKEQTNYNPCVRVFINKNDDDDGTDYYCDCTVNPFSVDTCNPKLFLDGVFLPSNERPFFFSFGTGETGSTIKSGWLLYRVIFDDTPTKRSVAPPRRPAFFCFEGPRSILLCFFISLFFSLFHSIPACPHTAPPPFSGRPWTHPKLPDPPPRSCCQPFRKSTHVAWQSWTRCRCIIIIIIIVTIHPSFDWLSQNKKDKHKKRGVRGNHHLIFYWKIEIVINHLYGATNIAVTLTYT